MSKQITNNDKKLSNEIKQLIEEAQNTVGRAVNVGMILMNWNIGWFI